MDTSGKNWKTLLSLLPAGWQQAAVARTKHLRLRSAPVPWALAPRPVAGLLFQLVNDKGRYCQHRETAAPETFKRCRLRPKFQVDHSTPLACSKTQRTFSPTLSAPFERDNVFYRVRSQLQFLDWFSARRSNSVDSG
jgi:hypothetical protein